MLRRVPLYWGLVEYSLSLKGLEGSPMQINIERSLFSETTIFLFPLQPPNDIWLTTWHLSLMLLQILALLRTIWQPNVFWYWFCRIQTKRRCAKFIPLPF